MDQLTELLAKVKIALDVYMKKLSNSLKMLFCIGKMGIDSPKMIGEKLGMAKSNVAILAGKLKLQKYIKQTKVNNKEIKYTITDLGQKKLEEKLEKLKISENVKAELREINKEIKGI